MKPPSALALKHPSVEEWTDVHFFRPAGIRVARALAPTRVTADQVTIAGLLVGLLAGHLVVYASLWLNLAGVGLLVVSDVLDSADGQLARLKGTSTRFGRVLDGCSDMVRFLNLYASLLVRMVQGHVGALPALVLVVAVVWSHSLQGATVDFIKNAFLETVTGRGGETDLPEDVAAGRLPRGARWLYGAYVRRQAMMFPATARVIRAVRRSAPGPAFAEAYAAAQAPLLPVLTLIATNIRFLLLGAAVVAGHVVWFLWATAVPMNVAMLGVILVHERNAAALLRRLAGVAEVPAIGD